MHKTTVMAMDYLINYGFFLLKTCTIAFAVLGVVFAARHKKGKQAMRTRYLNAVWQQIQYEHNQKILTKPAFKAYQTQHKLAKKHLKKIQNHLFVLRFKGDISATAVARLREEITAILTFAVPQRDRVLLCLDSPGGSVPGYGLAASQLQRLRAHNIHLTVAIDHMAASGGYLMACVANTIVAAPFAIIGSIGVVAQLPNFHRLLQKNHIDFEQITAGRHKRTLSLFGENTPEGRKKVQEDITATHELFKEYIKTHRPSVDTDQLATGEYWHASHALAHHLVDALITSDDYLLKEKDHTKIYELYTQHRPTLLERLGMGTMMRLPFYH